MLDSVDLDFRAWLYVRGWLPEELCEQELKLLRACYDCEQKATPPSPDQGGHEQPRDITGRWHSGDKKGR